jgi:hypothetical protein
MAAQACDTPESAALLPGMVAQPPFVRQRLRRASKHEPTPAESDAERREGT